MSQNCLIIAGEKSGEEHCLSFFDTLRSSCPQMHFWGVGGDSLKKKGMELLYHLKDFSSMGFSEVLLKLPFYLNALKNIEREVIKRNCKVAILIDFQDFNLKLSKKLKSLGVKVLYYVAPQAWAWKEWRAKRIQETTDTLFTIIPFEKRWFRERGVENVVSVRHPLWVTYKDQLKKRRQEKVLMDDWSWKKRPKKLLVLPGSRNSEVGTLLPVFMKSLKLLKKEHDLELLLVSSPNVDEDFYRPYLKCFKKVYSSDSFGKALEIADLSLAASGTVTLGTALFSIPTVVCYKLSHFNDFIFYNFLNYSGPISLANIVHEENIFPELFNERLSEFNIKKYLNLWLNNFQKFEEVKFKLDRTEHLVSGEMDDVSPYLAGLVKDSYSNHE